MIKVVILIFLKIKVLIYKYNEFIFNLIESVVVYKKRFWSLHMSV